MALERNQWLGIGILSGMAYLFGKERGEAESFEAEIGDTIICIKDDPNGYFKKGDRAKYLKFEDQIDRYYDLNDNYIGPLQYKVKLLHNENEFVVTPEIVDRYWRVVNEAESFGAELNQKQLEALKRIREKRNKSSEKEDETKCPCGGDIVEALVCNHCLEVHRLYGAESFEADECSLHNCENNMVCDLCDCCEDHCFCGYCDNDKCYNSGLNATNNDYTPVGIDNLCEDGFCEWCHTTKSHPNLVNQGYVASPYCECHAFNAESFEAPYSDVACSKCGEKTNRGDWFNGGTSWACQPCQEKMKRENKGGECLLCKWREATEGEYERVVCVECSRYRTGRGQEEGYTEIDCGSCGNSLTATELMRCGGCGESMCGECPGDTQDCVGCAE